MTFQNVVAYFDGCDYDKDGVREIEHLGLLRFEDPSASVDPQRKLVVVLVEPRLFASVPGARYAAEDLLQRIATLKVDLTDEGFDVRCLEIQLMRRSGDRYPGGKALLAIREFFKALRMAYPRFAGALLVGSFPDAKVTHLNPEHAEGTLAGTKCECYREGGFLRAEPSYDVVLADLDGNWSDLYHERIVLDRRTYFVTARTSVMPVQGTSKVLLKNPTLVLNEEGQPPGPAELYDTFLVRDAVYTETRSPDGTILVEFDVTAADPEVGRAERDRPNPIALPDICVSRIDPRSIAVRPPDRAAALDQDGKPQTAACSFVPEDWGRDPALERTLLVQYFDRNHAFRSGAFARLACSVSLLESGIGTGSGDQGVAGWPFSSEQPVTNATLLDFVRWLKRPATFRVISTHADAMSTQLRQSDADAPLVEAECGGRPWRWVDVNGKLEPSFRGHYTADLHVYRTLWENRQLAGACPSLVLHTGCDVHSVYNGTRPYDDATYGAFQNAQSLLFYANQLAVLCHVTWWNQGPSGFGNAFGSVPGGTFGDGWRGFFETSSRNSGLRQNQADRKRCYEWGIFGDWTLRKYYAGEAAVPARRIVAVRTSDGHFLTAVNGGGLGGQSSGNAVALETDRSRVGPWERFRIEWLDAGRQRFALKTVNGNYVTAVRGGGIGGPDDARSPIHTDASSLGSWERFAFNHDTDEGIVAIQAAGNRYLAAVNGGGVGGSNDVPLHTDATRVGPWEAFTLVSIQKVGLRTFDGHFVTAVEGGGLGGPNSGPLAVALHTDATRVGPWERFRVEWLDGAHQRFALRTVNGNYVTAVLGGGVGGPNDPRSPIHTDALWLGPWEQLTVTHDPSDGTVTIQTPDGHYLTAVNGGGFGRPDNVPIRTDATRLGPHETFTLVPWE